MQIPVIFRHLAGYYYRELFYHRDRNFLTCPGVIQRRLYILNELSRMEEWDENHI